MILTKDFLKNKFKDLYKLENITLISLEITSIEKDAFEGLYFLETLDLKYNKISRLDKNLFKHCISLKHLDLSNNRIKNIHPDTFRSLISLRSLSLFCNRIKFLRKNTFCFPKLNYLNLQLNPFIKYHLGQTENFLISKYYDDYIKKQNGIELYKNMNLFIQIKYFYPKPIIKKNLSYYYF
jgi:Leucine-rich repeat (LRR) protein